MHIREVEEGSQAEILVLKNNINQKNEKCSLISL